MVTKNFKHLMASLLSSRGSTVGLMECKDVSGNTRYIGDVTDNNAFPRAVTTAFTLNANTVGISVGSGTTAATEDDYQLESTITSGISGSLTILSSLDNDGNKYLQYDLIITNTGTEAITIGEIGYKQYIRATTAQNTATGSANNVCLIDRTVFATPIVIAVGDYAVIRYTLKTVLYTS